MLAQKQIERAAQASEVDVLSRAELELDTDNRTQKDDEATEAKNTSRTIQSEQEILLMYDVVQKHGKPEEVSKLVSSPIFGPVARFRCGEKELLMRVLDMHQRAQDWAAVFSLCKQCLEDEGVGSAGANLLAADWSIWQLFIKAAASLQSTDPEYDYLKPLYGKETDNIRIQSTVQRTLLKFAESASLRPIYRRNVLLARLSAVFTLSQPDGSDAVDGKASSLRLQELVRYLQDQLANTACYNDVKTFAEMLDETGLEWMATQLHDELRTGWEDAKDVAKAELLSLKMRYLVATCHSSSTQRAQQQQEDSQAPKTHSYEPIIRDALKSYQQHRDSTEPHMTGTLSELAILIALCYIESAELPSTSQAGSTSFASLLALYRALVVLEAQLQASPKDSVILLLLVQLHLRVGSAARARLLWDDLGVKRTIVDCIAPILYDRLSSISPILLSKADKRGAELSHCIRSHYHVSLKKPMPRRLIDAFESESYGSVLQIPEYIEDLRLGCTRAMSLVEEARTARLLEGPGGRVLDDPRYGK